MPPPSAPMIAQRSLVNSGWRPGVSHREMSVCRRVDARTTGGDVQHGVQDFKSDSHRLRGARCSNWALGALGLGYFKFCFQNSCAQIDPGN